MTNKQNSSSEESEAQISGVQKGDLGDSSRDPVSKDVLDAVNAPGKVFDAAEAARTNRHSGSAGGDRADQGYRKASNCR